MTNLEKHREEFAEAMDHIRYRECYRLLEISGLKCGPFKNCKECSNAFVDWLLEEPKVDWSQVKPGTKCLVRDYDDSSWIEREFAFFAFEKPWFFIGGSLDSMNKFTILVTYCYYRLKEDEK